MWEHVLVVVCMFPSHLPLSCFKPRPLTPTHSLFSISHIYSITLRALLIILSYFNKSYDP